METLQPKNRFHHWNVALKTSVEKQIEVLDSIAEQGWSLDWVQQKGIAGREHAIFITYRVSLCGTSVYGVFEKAASVF